FKTIQPYTNQDLRPKKEKDLTGDPLKQYEADIEEMDLILISIPNDIYNYVDSCQTTREMWLRVERLMQGNYDDEYQEETFQNDLEDSLTTAMMLLARSITQRYSTPTNNQLRSSSNIRNQAVLQADRVNIKSTNVGNNGRNARCLFNVQEESAESSNVQKETGNEQRTLRTSSSGNVTNVQCYNCNKKCHYARNCPKPRVQDSKYFMEQMLLATKNEAGVILSNEQNDFLLGDVA
nr:hypothetical protein [Tanacetum cinerariifolium]